MRFIFGNSALPWNSSASVNQIERFIANQSARRHSTKLPIFQEKVTFIKILFAAKFFRVYVRLIWIYKNQRWLLEIAFEFYFFLRIKIQFFFFSFWLPLKCLMNSRFRNQTSNLDLWRFIKNQESEKAHN